MSSSTVLRGVFALSLAVLAMGRASASAQAPAEPPEPAPVVMEEQVVRLPRAEVAGDPTAAATVIEASRFQGEAKGVAELVATAPGVAINDYGGLGQLATVSIRGSMSSGVLVLVDGLPLQSASGAGADLASIPRHWISRLEVLRGAEGAFYGAGALAGVVDVVTQPPRDGAWSAEAGYGSFRTVSAAGDAAAALGAWTVLAAGSLDASDGHYPYLLGTRPSFPGTPPEPRQRANNGFWRGGALLKVARPLGGWRLDGLLQASGGHRDLAGSHFLLTPNDRQEDGRLVAAARVAGPAAGRALDLALRLHARSDWLDLEVAPASLQRQRGQGAGADAEATLRHPAGSLRALLSASGEALHAGALGGGRTRSTLAAGLAEDLTLAGGRLRLGPALRAERVGPFSGWSGKLGARLALSDRVSLRASAGRTFRAPGFAELYLAQSMVLPNPDLRPETALGGDATVALEGAAGLLALTGFGQLYRDLIVYQQSTPQQLKPFNAGRAVMSGLEAEVALAPQARLLGLEASASYTLLQTETLRGPAKEVGRELPFRARHRFYGRVALSPGPVTLHLEAHAVGRQFIDAANTAAQAIPALRLWSAGASVRLWRRPPTRLHLEVRNLLDDRSLLDRIGNTLPGRMVMVTLRSGAPSQGDP